MTYKYNQWYKLLLLLLTNDNAHWRHDVKAATESLSKSCWPHHSPWTTVVQKVGDDSGSRQWKYADTTGRTISNAKILIYFSNQIYECNFIKQHSVTLLWFEISKMMIAVVKNKFNVSFPIIYWHIFVPYYCQGDHWPPPRQHCEMHCNIFLNSSSHSTSCYPLKAYISTKYWCSPKRELSNGEILSWTAVWFCSIISTMSRWVVGVYSLQHGYWHWRDVKVFIVSRLCTMSRQQVTECAVGSCQSSRVRSLRRLPATDRPAEPSSTAAHRHTCTNAYTKPSSTTVYRQSTDNGRGICWNQFLQAP